MKELKILAVVVFFTLVTYWLVEPYAHGVMHKKVDSKSFTYSDLDEVTKGVMSKTGDATRGEDLVVSGGCTGCHSINVADIPASMDAVTAAGVYGVNPPDLSNTGVIYDAKFLADLIKNPTHALKVEHKFTPESGEMHPMIPFYGAGGDIDQEIADMIAYLKSIAVKVEDVTPAMAYEDACGRCHTVDFVNWSYIGNTPTFKSKKDELAFEIQNLEYEDSLKAYMGMIPPDLSMYYLSRSPHYLSTFMENPQSYLKGTAMPRVGVTADSAEKIVEYLADSADSKRHQRDEIGTYVMYFSIIFAILAILWKKEVWRDLK